jgi:SAM-dependent methyltransferase
MPRSHAVDDSALLARVTARVLREGAQALYRDPQLFDQLYRRRRSDVAFYVRTAQRLVGSRRRSAAAPGRGPVLELGVGTGRVAIALARAGLEVVGVDAMPNMLSEAKARLAKQATAVSARVKLLRGDLRRVRLRRRFPLVLAPFNTFMHLYERDDLERAFATCHAHLAPGGRLVLDVLMPDLHALLQDPERLYTCPSVRHPRDGGVYRMLEASHYDPIAQVRSVTMLLGRADLPERRLAIPLTQRQLFPAELAMLLHYNGFAIEQRYGGFDESPLGPDSETQIVVARARARR